MSKISSGKWVWGLRGGGGGGGGGSSIPLPQGLGLQTPCRREGGIQQILRGTVVFSIVFCFVCVPSPLST